MSAEPEIPWLPASFVANARKQGEFLNEFADVPFMLVRIEDAGGELAAGLASTSTLGNYATEGGESFGMSTVAVETGAILEQLRRSQNAGLRPTGNKEISGEMLQLCYFVVPLRKRVSGEPPFMERISVGRTRNHDIVLRDRSVSKFHAYFQREEDSVFVSDAGSKNGTRIGDTKVTSSRTAVAYGATVTIGSIELTLCTATALDDVLRAR